MEAEITVSVFQNSVPQFVEAELDRLYGNIYASLAHHRLYGGITEDTSTYVARTKEKTLAVFLFRVEKNSVYVLNEQISVDAEEIERFACYIFSTFSSVHVISFHAVDTKIEWLPFPYQRFVCTEDIVLTLPATAHEYLGRLGKSTRQYISRYLNKLKRHYPSMCCNVYLDEEIREEHVRAVIELNRARMAGKSRVSYIDQEETERIIKLARSCGLVTLMMIDGRICAGVINYRVGENYFLKVIAHDPAYNDYRLGMLSCYLSIRECIEKGGKEYHFLWGRYEYKYRLLGIQRDLDHLSIYRSRIYFLLNAGRATRIAFDGYVHIASAWILQKARQKNSSSLASRLIFHSLNYLRSLKHFTAGLLVRR